MAESTLYSKVEEAIAEEVARGIFPPGDRLPSERELSERFQVSLITVRRAIQNLIQRGVLEIRRGLGTFVLLPQVEQQLTNLTGFVEDMEAHGRKASARVISKGVVPASARVAKNLCVSKGTRVVRIERVRLADGTPMSFDETFLPFDVGEQVLRHDLRVNPIFTLLEKKYSIPLVGAQYKLEAVAASAAVAQALEIRRGSPIFQIERTSFTVDRQPVDYEILSYRGDLIRFVTSLSRQGTSTKETPIQRPRTRP